MGTKLFYSQRNVVVIMIIISCITVMEKMGTRTCLRKQHRHRLECLSRIWIIQTAPQETGWGVPILTGRWSVSLLDFSGVLYKVTNSNSISKLHQLESLPLPSVLQKDNSCMFTALMTAKVTSFTITRLNCLTKVLQQFLWCATLMTSMIQIRGELSH